MTDAELDRAIRAARDAAGNRLLILAHHYQKDDVIAHADFTGDSLKLAQLAAMQAKQSDLEYIVFCGVHFMAETASMLVDESVQVILPDLSAGCSMADMADVDDAEVAWEQMHEMLGNDWNGRIIPVTYINSSAAVKAFVGRHGGACCTSSNAKAVLEWAFEGGDLPRRDGEEIKVFFLPDQHLGRNTASALGLVTENDAMAGRAQPQTLVWNPQAHAGGVKCDDLQHARVILWAGHCSVHMQFSADDVARARAARPGIRIIVHPECRKEVVDHADLQGSTERIIRAIEQAPAGSSWAIGTEVHLVNRLAAKAKQRGVHVQMLSRCHCLCVNMYRIDQPHLLWALDQLAAGHAANRITVPRELATSARLAIDRMLRLALSPGASVSAIS